MALVSAAAGQTFTLDDVAPYGPNTYRVVLDYAAGEVVFNNSTGTGPASYPVNPVSLKNSELTLADLSSIEVFDICAEMFVGPTGSSTYDVSAGFGALDPDQSLATRLLFSNTLSDFITARDTLPYDDASTIGAAIQMAFWEIAEDSLGTTTPSLDDNGAFPGQLNVDGFGVSYSGKADAAILLAESYLTNIRTGSWVDQGGLYYYYADATGEQDRLWVGLEQIPEPSAMLLGFAGGMLLLCRRRWR
jgi:hypothetical protein